VVSALLVKLHDLDWHDKGFGSAAFIDAGALPLVHSFSFVFIRVQSFERRKKKACYFIFDRSSDNAVRDDISRMLGFLFCFSSGFFGTTFGQSGGYSIENGPSRNGIRYLSPWKVLLRHEQP
jgi:hypothetical protein